MGSTMIVTAGIALVLLSFGAYQADAIKLNDLKDPIMEKTEEEAFQKLLEYESKIKSAVETIIRRVLPKVLRFSSELELSGGCMGSLLKLVTDIREMKLWAFKMADSTGIPVGGVLTGTPAAFGSYQQCLRVVIPQPSYDKGPKKTGQYCLLSISPPLPPNNGRKEILTSVFHRINATFKTELMNYISSKYLIVAYTAGLRLGICLPSSCSKEEVNQMIKLGGSQVGLNIKIDSCEVKEGFKMDNTQKTILAILSSFVLMCLLSTIIIEVKAYHEGKSAYDHKKKSYPYRVLLAFSIVVNFKSLMRTRPSENRSLDCMNGIRYITCTWVVLGHAYILYDLHMFREMGNLTVVLDDIFVSAITNAFLSVESFFFITSTLVSYITVKSYDSNKTFNPIIGILRRAWRMLPGVMLITGLVFLMPFVTSGPDYKEMVDSQIENCQKYWWTNIIYIGNFLPLNKLCMGHTWYISVDMQLYLVAMVYFLILFRNKIYGKMFLVLCLLVSIITSGTITYIMKYPPAILIRYLDFNFSLDYGKYVYLQPHVHLGVYTVGLFLGTYLARNPKVKLSQWTCFVGWIVAISSALANVYAVYPWNVNGVYTMVEAIVYSATNRTAWGACLAWLVLACYAGKSGYVNKILSWPGFQPLVKITYLIYLAHLLVLVAYNFSRQGPQDYTHSTLVFNFFSTLCVSHIVAVFFRLIYEAPLIEMERLFCAWLFSKPSKDDDEENTEKPALPMTKVDERSEYQIENGVENNTIENGNGNKNCNNSKTNL